MAIKKIPARALRFDAALEVAAQAEAPAETPAADPAPVENKGLATVPVTLRARSADVVNHWFWGRTVHDFAGMQPAAAKLPLDYCHNADEVVGFSDKQDISTNELVMSGQLVPFTAEDRASEVIHKSKAGIPYQASIYFDPESLVIEEVPAGMSAQANGQEYPGPVSVFRQWQLRGAAVCPYGMDANTSVQFSANDAEVCVQYKGELSAEPAPKPAEKPAGTEGQRFLTAFGDLGGKWYAEGKTFEQAQALFTKHLQDQVTSLTDQVAGLKKTNAEQAALLTAERGVQTPLAFTPAEEEIAPKPKKLQHLSDGMAKFASTVKIPRQAA